MTLFHRSLRKKQFQSVSIWGNARTKKLLELKGFRPVTDLELKLLYEEVIGRPEIAERWDYLRKNNPETYRTLRDIHERRMQELGSLSSPWMEYMRICAMPSELAGVEELRDLLQQAKSWWEEWRQLPHEEKMRRRRRIRHLQLLRRKTGDEPQARERETQEEANGQAILGMENRAERMIKELESRVRDREVSTKERIRAIKHFRK